MKVRLAQAGKSRRENLYVLYADGSMDAVNLYKSDEDCDIVRTMFTEYDEADTLTAVGPLRWDNEGVEMSMWGNNYPTLAYISNDNQLIILNPTIAPFLQEMGMNQEIPEDAEYISVPAYYYMMTKSNHSLGVSYPTVRKKISNSWVVSRDVDGNITGGYSPTNAPISGVQKNKGEYSVPIEAIFPGDPRRSDSECWVPNEEDKKIGRFYMEQLNRSALLLNQSTCEYDLARRARTAEDALNYLRKARELRDESNKAKMLIHLKNLPRTANVDFVFSVEVGNETRIMSQNVLEKLIETSFSEIRSITYCYANKLSRLKAVKNGTAIFVDIPCPPCCTRHEETAF